MDITKSVSGLLGKIEDNTQLLGAAIGVFGIGLDPFETAQRLATGYVHMPVPAVVVASLRDYAPANSALISAILAYVGGEIFGGKHGNALKNLGKGLGIATVANVIIWDSTHSDEGCKSEGYVPNPAGRSNSASASPSGYGY